MPQPGRILVRGVNWLGDAVMTTPALQRLREHFPSAHIALLGPEKLADLWQNHPSLNQVINFRSGENPWTIARRLRREHFDIAIVFPNSPRSALEIWLAGIPQRIGYARPWRNWLLTQAIPTRPGHQAMHKRKPSEIIRLIQSDAPAKAPPFSPTAHHTHDYLQLCGALGANPSPVTPTLIVSKDEVELVAKKFKLPQTSSANHPVFALNPGAEYGPAKRWPLDRFSAAAREIQKQTNCHWVIVGGKTDLPLASEIQAALGNPDTVSNLAGQTSLRELMALFKLSRVLLTNDTGPMHVAAALDTPVVVPFGSTSPELTGPGLPGDPRHHLLSAHVPCSPCFLRTCPIDFRCMNNIPIEKVVEAVLTAANK